MIRFWRSKFTPTDLGYDRDSVRETRYNPRGKLGPTCSMSSDCVNGKRRSGAHSLQVSCSPLLKCRYGGPVGESWSTGLAPPPAIFSLHEPPAAAWLAVEPRVYVTGFGEW